MADPAMRQALSFAIDKNEINTRLLGGTVQVAQHEHLARRLVLRGPDPGDVRPEKAKSILDAAGWIAGADGTREKNGLQGQDRALHDDPPGPR